MKQERLGKNVGFFTKFARATSAAAGHPSGFLMAVAIVVLWAFTGPLFGFSDTWQLVINTGTTIVTFLMVFLIQNTQNRDTQALQLKLDELIRATEGAHTAVIDVEELTEQEISTLRSRYLELAKEGRRRLRSGSHDTGIPAVEVDCEGKSKPSPTTR